jgi:hypothetical protein
MKLLLLLLLSVQKPPEKDPVFVCKNTTTYHAKKECSDIKSCKEDMLELSLEEATGAHKKKACKHCYKDTNFQLFPSPIIFPLDGEEE